MTDRLRPNGHAWLTELKPNGGPRKSWPKVTRLVRVMSLAEGYAMVRIAGGTPFVASLSDIEFVREAAASLAAATLAGEKG